MDWIEPLIEALVAQPRWGYRAAGPAATEPTAWATLACLAHGRTPRAEQGLDWLAAIQAADGSCGPYPGETAPGWFTSLAVLAWAAVERPHDAGFQHLTHNRYTQNIHWAVGWMNQIRGVTRPRVSEMGHDTTLAGWPWVEGTHGWVEPTALHVLALKAAGHGDDARPREAVRLLADRLLPGGGCNYGNTIVLGQELRPQVQPTGLAMMALAGESTADPRVEKSLQFLAGELSAATTTTSLCYGLLGLAAHDRLPAHAEHWLEHAWERARARDAGALKLALLALAALGSRCPLIGMTRIESP